MRANLDRAAIILDLQIATDPSPANGALRLPNRKLLDLQIAADGGFDKANGTGARNCRITIHGAVEVEVAATYCDVPFDLARLGKYAILPG